MARSLLLLLLLLLPLASCKFVNFQLLYTSDWSSYSRHELRFDRRLPPGFDHRVQIVWNGLGVFSVGSRTVQHAFDGLAKLAKVEFVADKERRLAYFSSRLLQTKQLNESVKAKDIAPYLMFESVVPPYSKMQRLQAMLNGLDNTNVNVYPMPERRMLALSDYARCYQVKLDSLETESRVVPFVDGRRLSLLSQISGAHPLAEAGTDRMLNFVSTVSPLQPLVDGRLRLVRYALAGSGSTVAEWPVARTAYMHSFSATAHHAVVFAAPLHIDVRLMMRTAEPFRSLKWRPHMPADVFVVRLDSGKVLKTRVKDSRFLMHHVNAFESHNATRVTFYATAYPDTGFFLGLELRTLNDDQKRNSIPVNSELRRYSIDLVSGETTSEVVPTAPKLPQLTRLEMPIINEAFRYRRNCFVYGIVMKSDDVNVANISLAKRSLCGQQAAEDRVWHRANHYPCEPHFVQRVGSAGEDDGFLVTLVLDGDARRTYVGVFDAKSLTLVSKAWLPVALPYRLHGRVFRP